MRLLPDESLPRKRKARLARLEVRTVPEMGWAGGTNGELLRLAEQEFEAFLTADRKLPNQQNLPTFRIAVRVLAAVSNRLRDTKSDIARPPVSEPSRGAPRDLQQSPFPLFPAPPDAKVHVRAKTGRTGGFG